VRQSGYDPTTGRRKVRQLGTFHSKRAATELARSVADGRAGTAIPREHRARQASELEVIVLDADDIELVFTSEVGGWIDPNDLGRIMERLAEEAHVPRLTPKGMRHTAQSIGRVVVLWVDFHRVDAEGLTHAHLDDASAGRRIDPGQYIVVGDEDADSAVAHVVDVDPDGVILLRVWIRSLPRRRAGERSVAPAVGGADDDVEQPDGSRPSAPASGTLTTRSSHAEGGVRRNPTQIEGARRLRPHRRTRPRRRRARRINPQSTMRR
jgi:hypothetical protein